MYPLESNPNKIIDRLPGANGNLLCTECSVRWYGRYDPTDESGLCWVCDLPGHPVSGVYFPNPSMLSDGPDVPGRHP